jgi:acyl-CoA thioesterase FadM
VPEDSAPAVVTFPLSLSRHAFGPRERARAGHLWRLFQDAAIEGSTRRGWPPSRYRTVSGGFVVRRMVVVHHSEAVFGDVIDARTWVSSFKRGMISDRQIRLHATPDGGTPRALASATQQWVFVLAPELKPARAPDDMVASFCPAELDGDVAPVVPPFDEPVAEAVFQTAFETWHTAMDPLAHANHPAYVDWADEALARWMAERGLDPHELVPVAEEVTFRSGIVAPEPARVALTRVGRAGSAVVFSGVVRGGDDRVCAELTLHRTTPEGPGPLLGLQ